MKVLLIDVNCKHSSTGKIVYDLYTELNKEGHTAAVCYGRGPVIFEHNIYKFSSNIEVYIHALLTRLTGLTGCFSPIATRNLLKFMDEFKPDVVHIHELHAYFVNIEPVIEYLKSRNIKTVWTFHCEFMYTGKCGHAHECEGWKSECGNCPQLGTYPSSWFLDRTERMLHEKKALFCGFENLTIVTPSQWLATRVKQSFLSDRDIRVVHNGIDTEALFHEREYSHLKEKHNISDEKILLAVAPHLISEQKGGKWILQLADVIGDLNVKIILIGVDGNMQISSKNIIALEKTRNQELLAEYYSMADLFLICSKRENFPTTCMESLSCGTPIIGFDTGGTKEVAPGKYGHFVDYGDICELEKLVRLFVLNELEIASKKECVQYGKTEYSTAKMTENYISVYEEPSLKE